MKEIKDVKGIILASERYRTELERQDQSTYMIIQFKPGMCICINAARKGIFRKEIEKGEFREGLYETVQCELALEEMGLYTEKINHSCNGNIMSNIHGRK